MAWQFYDSSGALRTTDPAGRGIVYSATAPSRTDVIWVDTSVSGYDATVSVLPSSPYDGQIVDFQNATMATDGVVWRFKYRAASASSYKWEFIGGAIWQKEVATNQTTASTSYTDLATTGPSLDVPVAGEYIVAAGAWITNSTAVAGSGLMSYSGAGTTAADQQGPRAGTVTATAGAADAQVLTSRQHTLTVATITAKYRASAGTFQFGQRSLSLLPVRVG